MTNDQPSTGRVETLTAEVRTLVVGRRQVTLSVYRQLDWKQPEDVEPFGRIRDAFESLARRGYVRRAEVEKGKTGRPSERWELHPELYTAPPQSHRTTSRRPGVL